jgi:hypothetical protein
MSSTPSHQTVRLSAGSHRWGSGEMCVMELASVLANDRFGDHPRSVCPIIGAFLRRYNDTVDDQRRQDLIPFAAKVVGTRARRRVRRARGRCFARWSGEVATGEGDRQPRLGIGPGLLAAERAAAVAANDSRLHGAVLALLDDVIALGHDGDGLVPDAPPADLRGADPGRRFAG